MLRPPELAKQVGEPDALHYRPAVQADRGDGQPLGAQERLGEGAEVLLLPPYSPDFNPIEEAFSKIEGSLRRAKARTLWALFEASG